MPRRRKTVALSGDSDEMSAPSPPQSEADGGALAPPTTRQPVGDWRLEIAGVVVLALVPRIIYLM